MGAFLETCFSKSASVSQTALRASFCAFSFVSIPSSFISVSSSVRACAFSTNHGSVCPFFFFDKKCLYARQVAALSEGVLQNEITLQAVRGDQFTDGDIGRHGCTISELFVS